MIILKEDMWLRILKSQNISSRLYGEKPDSMIINSIQKIQKKYIISNPHV